MHNLALALHQKGATITGSDDAIFEPSKTRLEKKGLLPEAMGWFPEKITSDIEAVILGMHAKADNPELLRAQELGLKIYSYPEFLYEQSVPAAGTPTKGLDKGWLCNTWFRLRHEDYDQLRELMTFLGETVKTDAQ